MAYFDPSEPMIPRPRVLLTGMIMLVGLFFFSEFLPTPLSPSLIAIVGIVVVAGFMSPRQKWLSLVNTALALLGTLIFSYEAFVTRAAARAGYYPDVLPWINLLLAVTFFFTLYFSVKTLRWRFGKGRERLWGKKLSASKAPAL
jgi:hypothetical protein